MVKLSEVQKSAGVFSHGLDFSTDCATIVTTTWKLPVLHCLQIRITPAELTYSTFIEIWFEEVHLFNPQSTDKYTNKIVIAA